MAIIGKHYDEKTHIDEDWYESSNVVYSKFIENESDNYGQLYVTFKNGATYHYKDVDMPTDYLLFKSGGIDNSQGKTLNKQIKAKYEYERVSDENIQELMERLENLKNDVEETAPDNGVMVYFISGHRRITQEEFDQSYKPAIDFVIESSPDCEFVIGDYWGCDEMAQNYLMDDLGLDTTRVTVYHMLEAPMYFNKKITNFVGGFESDEERDAAMTEASNEDIAFVRDHTVLSGTAQNILRRYRLDRNKIS